MTHLLNTPSKNLPRWLSAHLLVLRLVIVITLYFISFYYFFAVYALSIIESAQSEALLSGVKKGPFIRAGMFEMCPKQCSWARLYTHARPHNVYLGYVPS